MKRFKSLVLVVIVALAAIGLSSCGWFGGDEPLDLSSAIIEMPSALIPATEGVSASIQSRATDASATVIERVQSLFTPVRDHYNAMAYQALTATREWLDQIDLHVFQSEWVMDYLAENGALIVENETQTGRTEVTQSADGTAYTVRTWALVGEWTKTMDMSFTRAGDRLYGTVVARDDADASEDRPLYQIDFDTADPDYDGAMTTRLRAVNLSYGRLTDADPDNDVNRADKLWVLAYQREGEFHIAANVHYLDVKVEDTDFGPYYMPVLNNGQVDPYTYGAPGVDGCYSYLGAFLDSEEESRGKIDLALVPANYAGPVSIFTAYSVGATYAGGVANWVRADTVMQGHINDFLALHADNPDVPADVGPDSTTEGIFAALEFVQAELDEPNAELDQMLFVTLLTNPAYFDAAEEDSFIGSEDLNKPEWAADVPDYALSVEVDQTELPVLTVEMPGAGDAPPEPTP